MKKLIDGLTCVLDGTYDRDAALDRVIDAFPEFYEQVVDMLARHETKQAQDKIGQVVALFADLDHMLEIESKPEAKQAYYYGMVKALAMLYTDCAAQSASIADIDMEVAGSEATKAMLLHLMERNYVNHAALAEHIGLQSSDLSNRVKRLAPYHLIESQKHGRNRYYRITREGMDAVMRLQENTGGFVEVAVRVVESLLAAVTGCIGAVEPTSTEAVLARMKKGYGPDMPVWAENERIVGRLEALLRSVQKKDGVTITKTVHVKGGTVTVTYPAASRVSIKRSHGPYTPNRSTVSAESSHSAEQNRYVVPRPFGADLFAADATDDFFDADTYKSAALAIR